ncbi:uncharacterized protein LOC130957180 [Arachis stenosperma]|uniref:uncharacterized protein LOC130957180 n=1 Tax=Arachis stenosperma TaxID=217475 RepID=UPI0025AC42AB|nr:uncharacterized protein LOC130957180 [Arachis stenosperma]
MTNKAAKNFAFFISPAIFVVQVLYESFPFPFTKAWNNGVPDVVKSLIKVHMDALLFNKKTFGNVFVKKKELERQLNDIQISLECMEDLGSRAKEQGPDGFQTLFYKEFWNSLCYDVWGVRPFLSKIIGPLHGGFIPERGTTENIIIVEEIMSFMKNTTYRKGTMIFKIDLEKAYDRVDWRFLEAILVWFGFPRATIHLIMACVTSSSLSVLWNDEKL